MRHGGAVSGRGAHRGQVGASIYFFFLPRQNFDKTESLFFSLAEMSRNTVQPNGWVAIRLPSEVTRVLQVVPNTCASLPSVLSVSFFLP